AAGTRGSPCTTWRTAGSCRRASPWSYTAGISFFRARSPVTPKITRPHGPAILGSRLSWGSRSGLTTVTRQTPQSSTVRPDRSDAPSAGRTVGSRRGFGGGQQLREPGPAIGEVQPDHGTSGR